MLRVECIRELCTLDSILSDWNRLSNAVLMRRPSWLLAWWHAYQDSHRLFVLVARSDDNQIRGIMPLAETKNVLTGTTLVFMGGGKVCSDDQGIVCEEGYEDASANAFANWLAFSADCSPWDHLNLDGIRETDRVMQRFGNTLCSASQSSISYRPSPQCWKASLEGGLDAFRGRVSKRTRKILKEAAEELSSGRSQFQIVESLEQAKQILPEISRVHQMRWQERGIEGCFSDKLFTRFLETATHLLWDDPWSDAKESLPQDRFLGNRVQMCLLKIDNETAAGAICFRDRNSLSIYLTGMNPAFSRVRPGFQLLYGCIEHAIRLKCEAIDFLRGDEEYKERLGSVPVVQQRWLIPSSRWGSRMRFAAYRAASDVKTWWVTPSPISPSPTKAPGR